MANNYNQILSLVNAGNQMGLSNTIKRDYGIPLDFTSVQESYDDAVIYAAKSTLAYVGQTVAVGDKLYIISDVAAEAKYHAEDGQDYDNYLAEVGSKTEGDGNTIELDGQTLKLAGLTGLDNSKTYVPSLVNGKLVWAEPDTSTAEGQAQEINALKTRAAELEKTVNGVEAADGVEAVKGLVDLVAENAQAVQDLSEADTTIRSEFAAADSAIKDSIGEVAEGKTVVEMISDVEAKIPTDNASLSNGAGYQTAADVSDAIKDKADKADTLAGYGITDAYTKTEVDNKLTEVTNTIAGLTHMSTKVVASVPAAEEAELGVIYLVADEKAAGTYIEYILVEHDDASKTIEQIGSTATDLTDYAKTADVVTNDEFISFETTNTEAIADAKKAGTDAAEALESYKGEVTTALEGKVDKTAFEAFQGENTTAIATAKQEAIDAAADAEEAKGYAVATEVAETYAEKATTLAGYGITDAYTKSETVAKTDVYTKTEVDKLLDDVSGGSSETAASVKRALDGYIQSLDTEVYGAEVVAGWTSDEGYNPTYAATDSRIDKAIADAAEAKSQADKGVADAAAVAEDLTELANGAVATNTNDISAIKGRLTTVETAKGDHETRIGAVEGQITSIEATVNGNSTNIGALQGSVQALNAEDSRLAGLIEALGKDKANVSDVYTKGEVDTKVQDAINAIPEVDFTPYAKTEEVNAAISSVNEEVAKKANAADVYTKDDADAKFQTEAQVKSIVDGVVADVSETDTIEGLVTLVNYVHDNAGDIAKLVSDVETNSSAIETNAANISKNASDIVAINELLANIVQPKASEEISVAEDGTLGIIGMSTDKLVQGSNTLVLNGGNASVVTE